MDIVVMRVMYEVVMKAVKVVIGNGVNGTATRVALIMLHGKEAGGVIVMVSARL